MTQHDCYTRLDDLQQRVTTARSAVHSAAAESETQLKQRIDRAEADLDQSVQNARRDVSQAGVSARAKWTESLAVGVHREPASSLVTRVTLVLCRIGSPNVLA
jgi:hypothetical protein